MTDITAAIARVPLFGGRDMKAFRINGGITNINWRVVDQATRETFFVKLHGPGTEQFIDRETALSAAKIAAAKGVGPQVFFHDGDAGIEVHEFLQGFTSCGVDDAQDATVRANIMAAYKDVHDSLKLDLVNTGLQQFEDFTAKVVGRSAQVPADIDQLIWQCRRAKAAIEASGVSLAGCYNDAYISNYMRNDAGEIRIIDWEYAAANDPYWDVAMFSFEIFFDDLRGVASMLEMYEGQVREDVLARTYLYIGVAMVRWGLWAIYQSENSPIGFDFAKYSRMLLLRARRQIGSADWDWALSKV
ncbi:phosphotransferase [Pseudooceanicola sp. CBS1P-1]|uniref:Phosphotransferase n=1 Tax=Pseudooceanicola albus TaxID=2692189 RepID=A0A6L7G4T3_9RHOB|nr:MULTISPECIES: phosphotransferase [Pseudooceanicola]MBT9385292.1 phosphotransferase [Pseudooceanicola endophyticus]MXN18849.1 phosphotransferase [Pseudooceanicola albus]